MTRRTALGFVTLILGFIHGKHVSAQGNYLRLALDTVDGVIVTYRGQQVVVNPQELLDALSAESPRSFQQFRK